MALFDQIISGLTGERALRKVRDQSIRAAESAFNPNVFNPQIGVAQQQAVQGIDEGSYRRDVLNQLFRPVSSAVYGGNQAAAIAGASAQDMARTRALGQFESQMAQQDIQAKQAGAERLGQLQSSQLQMQGQRDAYTSMVRSEFESERDARRMRLGTAFAQFGIEAAGGAGAIGGAIGAGATKGLGALKGMFARLPQDAVSNVDITSPFKGSPLFKQFGSFTDEMPTAMKLSGDGIASAFTKRPTIFDEGSLLRNSFSFIGSDHARDQFGNRTDGAPLDWDEEPVVQSITPQVTQTAQAIDLTRPQAPTMEEYRRLVQQRQQEIFTAPIRAFQNFQSEVDFGPSNFGPGGNVKELQKNMDESLYKQYLLENHPEEYELRYGNPPQGPIRPNRQFNPAFFGSPVTQPLFLPRPDFYRGK